MRLNSSKLARTTNTSGARELGKQKQAADLRGFTRLQTRRKLVIQNQPRSGARIKAHGVSPGTLDVKESPGGATETFVVRALTYRSVAPPELGFVQSIPVAF